MAIVRVQGNARGVASSGTTVAAVMASTPISGNILVATVASRTSGATTTVSSIADGNAKVTWTYQIRSGAVAQDSVEIWFGVVAAGASKTQTATLAAASGNGIIINVCEYSGVATTSFLDKTATNTNTSTSPDTGTTAATTQADELWIGGTEIAGNYTQSLPTNGFTLLDGAGYSGGPLCNGFLEKIVSATGTANSGTTIASSVTWVGCIATFKAATAGGAAVQVKRRLLMGVGLSANIWNLNKHKLKFPRLTPKTF